MPVAGLVRVLGSELAEIPIVSTRPELQNHRFAHMLMRQLEAALIRSILCRDSDLNTAILPVLSTSVTATPYEFTLNYPFCKGQAHRSATGHGLEIFGLVHAQHADAMLQAWSDEGNHA